VESRFKREALHELKAEGRFHGIENAYDLPDRLPVLWAYAAGHVDGGEDGYPDGWPRLAVPSEEDRTRSRWAIRPAWMEVQRAFLVNPERPEHFGKIIRQRKEQHNILNVCNVFSVRVIIPDGNLFNSKFLEMELERLPRTRELR